MIPQNATILTPEKQIRAYFDCKWKPLLLGDKNPFNPNRDDGKEWQLEEITLEQALAHHKRGGNIGLQVGDVSGGLAVVDLDTPEAQRLARRFLPETLMSGKEGEDHPSHYAYISEGAPYLKIQDLGAGELLCLKASANGKGHQVKVAPSVHPKKGAYEWVDGFDPSRAATVDADDLIRRVRRLGIASLIRKYLPARGRHEYSKATAGTLIRQGYDADDLAEIVRIVWKDAGAPASAIAQAERNVYDTLARKEASESYTGGHTLNEMQDGLAARLVKAAGLSRDHRLAEDGRKVWTAEENEKIPQSVLRDRWIERHPGHVYSRGEWWRYGAGYWSPVPDDVVERQVMHVIEDSENASLSSTVLGSVTKLARLETRVGDSVWDRDAGLIVLGNGTLEAFNGRKFRDHSPDDYATSALPFDYDPNAVAEVYEAVLLQQLGEKTAGLLQEFAGYCLTRETDLETALWLQGEPGGGKSTIIEGFTTMLGARHGILGLAAIERSSFALANIPGKTLLTSTEQPAAFVRSTHIVDAIISGEEIDVERKFKEAHKIKPVAKILWAMNELPRVSSAVDGLFRRVKVVPVPPIPLEDRDPQIKADIREEGAGILNWALDGLERLIDRGYFDFPETVISATKEFKDHSDVPGIFVAARIKFKADSEVKSGTLYRHYKAWCQENGHNAKSSTAVAADWERLLPGSRVDRVKTKYWTGVELRDDGGLYGA
jgi:P4 family phage/plasmid primase-like protien